MIDGQKFTALQETIVSCHLRNKLGLLSREESKYLHKCHKITALTHWRKRRNLPLFLGV